MSEYEIFNNENEKIETMPEVKKVKKEKKAVIKEQSEKKECAFNKFVKENFKFSYVSVILAVLAIFFAFFVKFLPIVSFSPVGIGFTAAFFFIGFSCAFGALIVEIINMFKENKFQFNLKVILICLAFFVLFI